MSSQWPEIDQAEEEKRHELVLTGHGVEERICSTGLDPKLYSLVTLNFLEISRAGLTELSVDLGRLVNLTNLAIHGNKLTSLPASIGKLTKLKFLDMSGNRVESLPDEIGELNEVETLNVNCNQLTDFPDVGRMCRLHILDISHNQLSSLPDGIFSSDLVHLAQLIVNDNQIRGVPAELSELPSLKVLNIANNKIDTIPPEWSECLKLKEFNYGGNKLKDRRLAKMMDQCSTRAVLDYLKVILQKQGGGKGKGKKKGGKKGKKEKEVDEEVIVNMMNVLHFPDDDGITLKVTPAVADVRPYIVCCIVRRMNLQKSLNMFKRFITLQTKLHDNVCQKRQAATIATHDLRSVKSPLIYDARDPQSITLVPLFKTKETTADKMVAKLRQEAEDLRKEKKRNTFSGIHKYLDLLKDKPLYPCIVDNEATVISFPPITNCDKTKVSKETTDIMIEVTSSLNLDTCKTVMDEFLCELLEMGVGPGDDNQASGGSDDKPLKSNQKLIVEQVKILDPEGTLKVVYPSRTDLQSDAFEVVRNYE